MPYLNGLQDKVAGLLMKDILDELVEVKLYPYNNPSKPVSLPGLWHGARANRGWRATERRILGGGDMHIDDGMGPTRIVFTRYFDSDETLQSLISQGINAAAEAIGMAKTRTCYDDLRDMEKIHATVDDEGAKMVWAIDNELAAIFKMKEVVFEGDLQVADYQGEPVIVVSFTLREFKRYTAEGIGL